MNSQPIALNEIHVISRACAMVENSSLETSIKCAFERSVGACWPSLLKIVPPSPWKTIYMFDLLVSHWNSIFAHQFPRKLYSCAQFCLDILKSHRSDEYEHVDRTETVLFLQNLAEVLFFFGLEASHKLRKLVNVFCE